MGALCISSLQNYDWSIVLLSAPLSSLWKKVDVHLC